MNSCRRQAAALTWLLLAAAPAVAADSTGLVPLTELGTGTYQGFEGGLYPGGANTPPPAHRALALSAAASVVPRDASGLPDPGGLIGLLGVGMSNSAQEFKVFERDADTNVRRNAQLVLINGAQGGVGAERMADPADPYWSVLDARIAASELSPAQVQVCWIKQAFGTIPTAAFPDHALALRDDVAEIVRQLKARFPNLALCYLSTRIYGGYSDRVDRGEPLSYETGFAVRWLIEQQIAGDPDLNADPAQGPVVAPVLLWGPYLWADGVVPRADGLTYLRDDLETDAVHPAPGAERKVGDLLLRFFGADETTRDWWAKTVAWDLAATSAVADATLNEAVPGSNFGRQPTLRLRAGAGQELRVLLRFDLSAQSGPPLHAKLSLRNAVDTGTGPRAHHVADDGWDEATVTWDIAPAIDPQPIAPETSWSRDSSPSIGVTATLGADTDGLLSLALLTSGGSLQELISREGGEAPRLVLAVPTRFITVFVEADPANDAVVLTWNPLGDSGYDVDRADGPTPTDFADALRRFAPSERFDDIGALSDGQSWFYLVTASGPPP
ncbi:MAG: DNRLRE domain-containing protein [Acidobacteria bacterium]|nr:MAG: DNRLRE domain-containing protein [Acidobacteriota bacterium]